MNFLNKMERKFGRYAIHNLTKYMILCYIIGYALQYMQELFEVPLISYLYMSPYHILRGGQIWRLVSWLLIPPGSDNIFFVLIMLMFYYSLGTTLERTWGAFRYNVYVLGGILCTIIGAFYCILLWEIFPYITCRHFQLITSTCPFSWLLP